jgi:hypothetical protein
MEKRKIALVSKTIEVSIQKKRKQCLSLINIKTLINNKLNEDSNYKNNIIINKLKLDSDLIINIFSRIQFKLNNKFNKLPRLPIKPTVIKQILDRQNYKCNNHGPSCINYIINYTCPRWLLNNGYFDESGYEIDHIFEYSIGGSNDEYNLQALCPNCHRVKSKRFTEHGGNILLSKEINNGYRFTYNETLKLYILYHTDNINEKINLYTYYQMYDSLLNNK